MRKDLTQYVSPESLVARPQVRKHFSKASIRGLAMSFRKLGILQPIRVRRREDGKLEIVFGERRWLAAKEAGLETVPVIIVDGTEGEVERICTQLVENLQRYDLLPLEKAEGIDRVMRLTGWNATETGHVLGLSGGSITKLRSLLTAPEPMKEKLASGEIAGSTAYEILAQVSDPTRQIELTELAAKGQLPREAVGRAAKQPKRAASTTRRARPPRVTTTLSKGCSFTLSGAEWSLELLADLFDDSAAKAKAALAQGATLKDFLQSLKGRAQS